MALQMVTANRLRDGAVVYLEPDGAWSPDVNRGVTGKEAATEALLVRARDAVAHQIVVDPYLIEVAADAGDVRPLSFRERIRAQGPTVQVRTGE